MVGRRAGRAVNKRRTGPKNKGEVSWSRAAEKFAFIPERHATLARCHTVRDVVIIIIIIISIILVEISPHFGIPRRYACYTRTISSLFSLSNRPRRKHRAMNETAPNNGQVTTRALPHTCTRANANAIANALSTLAFISKSQYPLIDINRNDFAFETRRTRVRNNT